jgi:hypothetical protein
VSTDTSVSPSRITLQVCEGATSLYGIYEVKDDMLRLNVTPDSTASLKMTTFPTDKPEFRLVSRVIPAEFSEAMQKIPPVRNSAGGDKLSSQAEQDLPGIEATTQTEATSKAP